VPVDNWQAEQQVLQGIGHLHLPEHALVLQTVTKWLKEHL
jgi:hypothetical protein